MSSGLTFTVGSCIDSASFEAQALDWIELRRLLRRIITKKYSSGRSKQAGKDHDLRRELHLPVQGILQQRRAQNSQDHSENSSQQADDHGLAEKLQLHVAFRGSNSHADADLARPLCDGDEH